MRILLLSLVVLFAVGACKKYPEGPILSLHSRDVRVAGSWSVEKMMVNLQENTGFYSKYAYSYGSDNSYSENNGFNTLNGSWAFSANQDSIIINYNTNQVLHRYKILKLKNKSMWLIEDVNGTSYEWHFKTN